MVDSISSNYAVGGNYSPRANSNLFSGSNNNPLLAFGSDAYDGDIMMSKMDFSGNTAQNQNTAAIQAQVPDQTQTQTSFTGTTDDVLSQNLSGYLTNPDAIQQKQTHYGRNIGAAVGFTAPFLTKIPDIMKNGFKKAVKFKSLGLTSLIVGVAGLAIGSFIDKFVNGGNAQQSEQAQTEEQQQYAQQLQAQAQQQVVPQQQNINTVA